ncbi:hypothetical protein AB3X94_30825 [Paraburkholderia sp. BR10923]|uniref:hypothetical protein n=1 Tax=Paraburkholderia sp. BR10923 TaxID=3236992 RepID=UPI0034CD7E8E
MFKQLWLLSAYEVYQQFTYINPISQPSSSTPLLLGVSRSFLTERICPKRPGATLSEELHTPPLPVTHVFLGYCWSHSRFTSSLEHQAGQNNDTPSFRSYRFANPLPLKAQELHTTSRLVGGDEAADWAEPDGNQVNTMRSSGWTSPDHASQKYGA